ILKQSSRKFQKHRCFMFYLFNRIQRSEVNVQSHLKFIKDPDYDFSLTKNDLQECLQHLCQKDKQPPNQTIPKILQRLSLTGKHVTGSNEAMKYKRNEIRSLLILRGCPAFWITLNPSDITNNVFAIIAGTEITAEMIQN